MHLSTYLFEIFPKVVQYKLAFSGFMQPPSPLYFTFSVTNRCQSRCKTCKIWELYLKHPERRKDELRLDEIEKIFRNLGHIYFFNIMGGEPYLREDLAEIVDLGLQHLTPGIVHIPTNGLAPKVIERETLRILRNMKRRDIGIPLTVKPSLDGIGEKHDEIRGVKGNFEKVMDTLDRLQAIRGTYSSLYIDIGTTISVQNIHNLDEIADYVHELDIESYRSEVADNRSAFFNLEDTITPTADAYERAIKNFAQKIRSDLRRKRRLTRIMESFRLTYYDIAVQILREKRQVIPCYAGLSNIYVNPYGEVWPCGLLGYDRPMGNLRAVDYDYGRIASSEQAKRVRKFIRRGKCTCTCATQIYPSMLCNPLSMLRVTGNLVKNL